MIYFRCEVAGLDCGPAAASPWNGDVMVSVFAMCKYQIGKELCPWQQGSSWRFRERKKKAAENESPF